ncbi:Pentatricopeptide repeat-containing protein, partial [Thalictrum thalictroides]
MREVLIVGSTLLPPNNNHPTPPPPLPPTTTTPKPYTNKHYPPAKLSRSSSFSRPPLLLKSFESKSSSSNYYGGLASKLAQEGKLEEFLMIAETVLVSIPSSVFVASLNVKLVSLGVSTLISDDRLELVIGFMNRILKLGINPSLLFDKSVTKLLAFKCRALVRTNKLKEAVNLMETLAGFHFSIKEFVKPSEIFKLCVQESDPEAAVRYACMLPNATNLFSSIILKFGKKGDLSSSVIAYEASKCKSDGPNMYACRTMIDVCALCGDFMKSRCIYE